MTALQKGRLVFLLISTLQLILILFVQSLGMDHLFLFWAYIGLAVLNALQIIFSRGFEDSSPQSFLGAAIGVTAAFSIFSVLEPTGSAVHGWYPTPIASSNFFLTLSTFPPIVFRIAIALGYLATTLGIAGILRTLERRPSLMLIFAFNPVVLLLLISGDAVFIPLGFLMLSVHLLLKQKWWAAYAFLGLAAGVSLATLILLPFYVRHQFAYIAPEKKIVNALSAIAIAIVASFFASLPLSNIVWLFGDAWKGTSMVVVALICASLILTVLLLRGELAGRDTVLYAMLLSFTMLIVASLDLSLTMLILLLPLAAIFRSLPQIWLIFAAGLLHALHVPYGDPLTSAVAGGIFLVLFILQGRHALRETGLFKTIEMQDGAI